MVSTMFLKIPVKMILTDDIEKASHPYVQAQVDHNQPHTTGPSNVQVSTSLSK